MVGNKESMSALKIMHYCLLQYMIKTVHPVAGATGKKNFMRNVNSVYAFRRYVDLHILCLQFRHKFLKVIPERLQDKKEF